MPSHVILDKNDAGRRIDKVIRILYPSLPLSGIYKLFRQGQVKVNGKKVIASYKTELGDCIELYGRELQGSALNEVHETKLGNGAALFKAMIICQNDDLAFINKPKGILTHGAGGINELASAWLSDNLSVTFRPAPLHRLDRNTSGILAVSKSLKGAQVFSKAMQDGHIGKEYIALLSNRLASTQVWEDYLYHDEINKKSIKTSAGIKALSLVSPIISTEHYTLASIQLKTGRYHQIRAQALSHGYPLAFDKKYNPKAKAASYILHCSRLRPEPNAIFDGLPEIHAPLCPEDMLVLAKLFGSDIKDLKL